MKKLLLVSLMSLTSLGAVSLPAQAAGSDDLYVGGFAAWAAEMRKAGSDVMSASADSYVKDANKVIARTGYIGKELPIPAATKVADGVYTIVGWQIWHNAGNYGLNNNISFVIFEDGVFVFNAGANAAIAYSVHQQIKRITDKPVKWLAVENNQGHAYFGASYWYDVGVRNMYSSTQANEAFDTAFDSSKAEWSARVGKLITRSVRNVSDKFTTFDGRKTIDVGGGETFELIDYGPGHTPASTSVYIKSRNIMLTGDLAFNERMPVMFRYTNSFDWMASFEAMMKDVPADAVMIPGHGTVTDLATVKKQTYDYFRYVQNEVQKVVDAGGDQAAAEAIDQSMYAHRPVFEQAAKNNARKVYVEITGGDL